MMHLARVFCRRVFAADDGTNGSTTVTVEVAEADAARVAAEAEASVAAAAAETALAAAAAATTMANVAASEAAAEAAAEVAETKRSIEECQAELGNLRALISAQGTALETLTVQLSELSEVFRLSIQPPQTETVTLEPEELVEESPAPIEEKSEALAVPVRRRLRWV